MNNIPEFQHNKEITKNLEYWKKKPLLQKIYNDFYRLIIQNIDFYLPGKIVELGSGIGNLKSAVPQAICTDLFSNPWIDQIENAYQLSFQDNSISNIILFDVFHHFEHPGSAFKEFSRVLIPNGRVIIFEPYISIFGYLIYGLFHHEPLSSGSIKWLASPDTNFGKLNYYAAQGNASKIFFNKKYHNLLKTWDVIVKKRISSFSYVASGGYSKPQLYPDRFYTVINIIDKCLGVLPWLFATRTLIVLKKNI